VVHSHRTGMQTEEDSDSDLLTVLFFNSEVLSLIESNFVGNVDGTVHFKRVEKERNYNVRVQLLDFENSKNTSLLMNEKVLMKEKDDSRMKLLLLKGDIRAVVRDTGLYTMLKAVYKSGVINHEKNAIFGFYKNNDFTRSVRATKCG